jgi:hypothetical protein
MLGLWSYGDGPSLVLLFRADTVELHRTAPASGGGKLDLDHLIAAVVDGRRPTHTALPLGANGLLVIPIDEEPSSIQAVLRVGLPRDLATRRTNHFNAVLLLTTHQDGGRDLSRIEQMFTRSQLSALEIRMDALRYGLIGRGGGGRLYMREQMRGIFLARFGQMPFVAGPPRLALFARAGFGILWRINELFARRKIVMAAPTELALDPDVVLKPDAAQDLDGRDLL